MMRISKLSERAGLPVGTVKFYLRTGLLHPGLATSATQALYDEEHLRRLRTIRALLEVGGLSLAEIQRVLDAMEAPVAAAAPAQSRMAAVDRAMAGAQPDPVDLEGARALVSTLGWQVAPDSPHLAPLAAALDALALVGVEPGEARMRAYAEAAAHLARHDLEALKSVPPRQRPATHALTAILTDPLLSSLRRLAAEHHQRGVRGRVPRQRVSVRPG